MSSSFMRMRAESGISRAEVALIVVIVAIIAVLAVPGLWRARMARNEAAAIDTLREIVRAQVAYASVCGQNRYAPSFAALVVPARGSTQPFLQQDFAVPAPERRGFRFTLKPAEGAVPGPADCNGTPTTTGYYAAAEPVSFGRTGARSFAVNTVGNIWQTPAAAPPYEPFAAPATPIR